MFLEFDISISHSVRDTFLSTGNEAAYKVRPQLEKRFVCMQTRHLGHFDCFVSTVEAPVSGHPREAGKASPTGAGRLRESVNTEFV